MYCTVLSVRKWHVIRNKEESRKGNTEADPKTAPVTGGFRRTRSGIAVRLTVRACCSYPARSWRQSARQASPVFQASCSGFWAKQYSHCCLGVITLLRGKVYLWRIRGNSKHGSKLKLGVSKNETARVQCVTWDLPGRAKSGTMTS